MSAPESPASTGPARSPWWPERPARHDASPWCQRRTRAWTGGTGRRSDPLSSPPAHAPGTTERTDDPPLARRERAAAQDLRILHRDERVLVEPIDDRHDLIEIV